MDFSIPEAIAEDVSRFELFLDHHLKPYLAQWYKKGEVPVDFYHSLGKEGWFGIQWSKGNLVRTSALREAFVEENLARISPGIAVAMLAHVNLGFAGLYLFGSRTLKEKYGKAAAAGEVILSLGNTENKAGSDVAGISMTAAKIEGGWVLNGTKAYVTNGAFADLSVITAITDPQEPRNSRMSMFLVDLNSSGLHRKKLNKRVWIPSDLTRLDFKDVFVPDSHILGQQGRGLQQVLEIFTYCRVPISALTLGTAAGAFDMAFKHACRRKVFGKRIVDFQAKAFEVADYYTRLEAARTMLWRACEAIDNGRDFRQASSLAKYLAVETAREVTPWAADMFGAASVVFEHPIHKYPMDTWAASLGEGTQDVQKLVIFRELMKQFHPEY